MFVFLSICVFVFVICIFLCMAACWSSVLLLAGKPLQSCREYQVPRADDFSHARCVRSRIQYVCVCVCVFVLRIYVSCIPNIPVFLSFCSFPYILINSILFHIVVHFSYNQVLLDKQPASFTLPHPSLSCLWPIPSFFVSIVFLSNAVLISVALFLLYFRAPLFYYLLPVSIVFLTPPFYYLLPPDICQPCPSCQPEFAPPVLSFVQ